MADALLTVSNLETYYGPIMAIRGVSFTVPERAIVTILGANGAGKTTILKTVSGAMDPQKGTVTFAGREIQRRDPDQVARLGITVLMVEHDMSLVSAVSDRVLAVNYGRAIALGTAREVQEHPDVITAYLGG